MRNKIGIGQTGIERIGLETAMPDGCRLAADLWCPAGAAKRPALLQRLPYGRTVASAPVLPSPAQLARLGYAVVVQDVRGTGDSEGEFVPFVSEAVDGAATVEWVADQPWCNGDVAMYGFSYQGLDQLQAAALRPRGLRAIAPMMCAAEPYGLLYDQGCLKWLFAAAWAAQLSRLGGCDRQADLAALPLATALGPEPPSWWLDWVGNDRRDGYWESLAPDLGAIDVPAFTVLGYADTFATATARLAGELGARLVCGPWAHMPWGTRLGDLELGPDAGPAPAIEAWLAWLAEVVPAPALPGEAGAPLGGPAAGGGCQAVRYFVVGRGWEEAPAWPPPGERRLLVARSGVRGANSRHGDGSLVPADEQGFVCRSRFCVPEPTESAGSGTQNPNHADGAHPEAPLADVIVAEPLVPVPGTAVPYPDVAAAEDRRDVLCYTAAPEARAIVLACSPLVRVTARIDGPGMDLVASLVLVEGSTARSIASGACRLTAPAGAPLGAVVELTPIAWEIPGGARLRLDLSASRFPLYARHPQAEGGPMAERAAGGYRVATVQVLAASVELASPAGVT